MENDNIRWKYRLSYFTKALAKLEEAVVKIRDEYGITENGVIHEDTFLDDILKEGVIQRFGYTHELAWKVMKDFFESAGNASIYGSKDATREAFSEGLINHYT